MAVFGQAGQNHVTLSASRMKPPGSAGGYGENAMGVLLNINNKMTMNVWMNASVREEIRNNSQRK